MTDKKTKELEDICNKAGDVFLKTMDDNNIPGQMSMSYLVHLLTLCFEIQNFTTEDARECCDAIKSDILNDMVERGIE